MSDSRVRAPSPSEPVGLSYLREDEQAILTNLIERLGPSHDHIPLVLTRMERDAVHKAGLVTLRANVATQPGGREYELERSNKALAERVVQTQIAGAEVANLYAEALTITQGFVNATREALGYLKTRHTVKASEVLREALTHWEEINEGGQAAVEGGQAAVEDNAGREKGAPGSGLREGAGPDAEAASGREGDGGPGEEGAGEAGEEPIGPVA